MNWSVILIGIVVAAPLAAALFAVIWTRLIARRAKRLVPPIGKFVHVDGALIHYVEAGEGPPIVLIHGLGGHLHHMRRPLMETIGGGYRLIAMDRPGSGYSTRPKGDGDLVEQARFISRFIETLGLDRALLVGHSLGGAIALRTALDHPHRVAGLVLIAPLTHPMREVVPAFALLDIGSPWLRRLVAETVALPRAEHDAPRTLAFVFGPQKPPEDFAVEGGALCGMRPSHFYAASTDLVAVHGRQDDMTSRYGEIGVPVGIIFGDADRVIDYGEHGASMVGRIADLEIEVLEGVGHMVQFAEPVRTAALIRRVADRAFAP